jgi:hypothetical protein
VNRSAAAKWCSNLCITACAIGVFATIMSANYLAILWSTVALALAIKARATMRLSMGKP